MAPTTAEVMAIFRPLKTCGMAVGIWTFSMDWAGAGAHRADHVQHVGFDGLQAGDGGDDDGEEGDQEGHRDFRLQAKTEPDDEQGCDGDLGDGLGADDQRHQRALRRAVQHDRQRQKDAEHHADQKANDDDRSVARLCFQNRARSWTMRCEHLFGRRQQVVGDGEHLDRAGPGGEDAPAAPRSAAGRCRDGASLGSRGSGMDRVIPMREARIIVARFSRSVRPP